MYHLQLWDAAGTVFDIGVTTTADVKLKFECQGIWDFFSKASFIPGKLWRSPIQTYQSIFLAGGLGFHAHFQEDRPEKVSEITIILPYPFFFLPDKILFDNSVNYSSYCSQMHFQDAFM